KKVTLMGAGGKMGMRTTANLKDLPEYDMSYIEINPQGVEKLKNIGIAVSDAKKVLADTDVVILAVPDVAIKKVAGDVVPQLKSVAMAVTRDPAPPYAGHLPERADITYLATQPSHPSVFTWEEKEKDHYGCFD